jgi:hypothetical protein
VLNPPEPARVVREPGKPHLRARPRDRRGDPDCWMCSALYGVVGYGRTKIAAYNAWVDGNALNIDGPYLARRVRPSLRERIVIRELKELLNG